MSYHLCISVGLDMIWKKMLSCYAMPCIGKLDRYRPTHTVNIGGAKPGVASLSSRRPKAVG